ncbi:hypothetical protein BUALT_Bualt03G0062300 [Buddleja alternifolia]|uniref:Uncharacterized protein n=1 Tax=Buddleja alternifolia TaxID=168488 RepID=A0AAV6XTQ6_9LAMI|nr:hypothetical protein BUALT_Bualt03G0062300 [Buddleja alternifolia]
MIVRKYGRRSRGMMRSYSGTTNSFSDVVSESSSQECPQDVYNFTFSSQDSARGVWSDPYSFGSSQESRQLTILPPRNDGDDEDVLDRGLWNPYAVVEISDGDFQKSKKIKKINSGPFGYNASQELEEFEVLPQRKGGHDSVFDFSENVDFWASKTKNVDCDLYGLSSSQELRESGISGQRECEANRNSWAVDVVPRKSKRNDVRDNVVLQKKKSKNKKKMKSKKLGSGGLVPTTTLMETQEFGEMMEHVDEVNFALDGLKNGQQVRIRRASLLSLLSICGTAQQRRLLRVHGMAKTIIDAVLGLSFDDPPSNLAAAALCYLLTSDGQEDRLLDSPSCIRFLIKLLKPLTSNAVKEKVPTIGSKLLGMCKNAGFIQDSAKGTDSSCTAIMLKVQEILVNCKEMKPRDDSDDRMEEPELNPKWISLLTMEKACLSTISIEDTSGTVRKTGGYFKEKLREFGGLDAVFEVARKCHSIMEEWLERSPTFALDLKDISGLESLLLLLKCLKIMENATFLSKDNHCHLLGMKGKFDGQRAPRSFIKLVLSVIKILSGVSLLRSSLSSFHDEKAGDISNRKSNSGGCCSMECTASQNSLSMSQCNQSPHVSANPLLLKMRMESSVSCSGTSRNSNSVLFISSNDSELEVDIRKKQPICTNFGAIEDSQDPFAFDDEDFEPSKWDLLSGTVKKSIPQDRATVSKYEDGNHPLLVLSQQESSNIDSRNSQEASCSSAGDEEKSNLLADCLLTAVKVLMNLANDNPEGCQQIATCGGLEILSSLIAGHFPSFNSTLPHFVNVGERNLSSKSSPRINQQSNTHLTDQELDFLVAILGLLVNLVEKDAGNRSRLAEASVSLPSMEGLGLEDQKDVISLLCSIFLANQGAGEAAGEGKYLSWEDEDSILQGEKEAEKMIVEAYAALLLAFLSTESRSTRNAIADCLPNHNLAILVPVLERFVEFHLTLNMISPETHTAVLEVNGCTGKMGRAVLEAAMSAGLSPVPVALGGPEDSGKILDFGGKQIEVHGPSEREHILSSVFKDYPNLIVVDYTLPAAVNDNAALYCKVGVPFVMGTTGGDRDLLYKTVTDSNVYAVISPQMGKQVVAFLAAMEIMAEQFPGAFSGYNLEVKLIRDPRLQVQMVGVPEEHLSGHAFHMYHLTSPDGTVSFEFQHNVCGRSIYAEGTVDAILFLAKKVNSNADKRIYDMIDVLREGNMR